MTCPFKPGTQAAERWATKQARRQALEDAKAKKRAELASAIEQVNPLLKVPKQIGDWGVIRTRAWSVAHRRLSLAVQAKRPSVGELQERAQLVQEIISGKASDQACSELVSEFGKARG